MNLLVTGASGILGNDLVQELLKRNHTVYATDLVNRLEVDVPFIQLDLTDSNAVEQTLSQLPLDGVMHPAAWTAVDEAEKEENHEKVMAINGTATEFLAKYCKKRDIPLLYVSTDYVFAGTGEEPIQPDNTDFAPINYYGVTKLRGEEGVRKHLDRYYITRIAWVFGKNGNNFVKTMVRLGQTHSELRVVKDQIGTPTYTPDLARLLVDLMESDQYGNYHITNEGGYISWYDLAVATFEEAGMEVHVTPVRTEEYGESLAKRPLNSRLDKKKILEKGLKPLPDWRDALHRYVAILKKENQGNS